jgi:hypothetical protein
MPAVPSSLLEPIWVEFAVAVGTEERPEFDSSHPLGCHRRRIWDRVVFEHLLDALVHGSGYERIATQTCSDRTIRRRLAGSSPRVWCVGRLRVIFCAVRRVGPGPGLGSPWCRCRRG